MEVVIFVVFVVVFIWMFLIEVYVILIFFMEGFLLVGDFLFVSKVYYGICMLEMVAMILLLYNCVLVIDVELYLKKFKLFYYCLFVFESIDCNDFIVFNYLEGDSVYIFFGWIWSIYDYNWGVILL